MADKFCPKTRLPRNFQGPLTCRKSATWDRRLYFPSEGRRAEDFFARKIRWLRPGLNPRSWVPEASTLTTRPPKPLALAKRGPKNESFAYYQKETGLYESLYINRCVISRPLVCYSINFFSYEDSQKTKQRAPMTLNQQLKDISTWNTPSISCTAQV